MSINPGSPIRRSCDPINISPGHKSLDAELYGLGRTIKHLQPPGGNESGVFDAYRLPPDVSTPRKKVRFRKLFVGGIHPNITDKDIKEYFGKFGPITNCTIHRDRLTGRSRGFGFITFDDPASVDDVQQNRPHIIEGCELTLKRAVPKELFYECDGLLTVNRIFVGGLRQEVEESDLREYFSKYGNVRKIEIMVDRHTNAKRGFAFIEFTDYDPVDKAVMQGKHKIGGQDVTVKKAKSRLEMELIKQTAVPKELFTPLPRRMSMLPFEAPRAYEPLGPAFNRPSFESFLAFDCPFHYSTRRRRYL